MTDDRGQMTDGRWQKTEKVEVGPVVVPNERDYAAAKDAEGGKKR